MIFNSWQAFFCQHFSLEVWVGWGVLWLVVVILKSVEFFYFVKSSFRNKGKTITVLKKAGLCPHTTKNFKERQIHIAVGSFHFRKILMCWKSWWETISIQSEAMRARGIIVLISKIQLAGQKYWDKTALASKMRFSRQSFGFQSQRFSLLVGYNI